MTAPARAYVLPFSCGGCDNRWSGTSMAHCAGCHRTFTTVGNFDKHRSGSRSGHAAGECSDPADRGLVENARGQWSAPGREVPA